MGKQAALAVHHPTAFAQWLLAIQLAGSTVDEIAVVGDPRHVGAEIVRRFSGLVDRFTLYTPYPLDDEVRAVLVEALHGAT